MDFELNLGDEEGFCLNLPEIVRSRTIIGPIRLLAAEMQERPYMSVGEWMSGLDFISFQQIFDLADADDNDETMMEQLLLLTMMLSSAEGTSVNGQNMDELATQLSMLRQLIVFTSLEKKGLVRCYYEHFTLGTDMGDKTIVEKL